MTQGRRGQQDERNEPSEYQLDRYREYMDSRERRSAFWQTVRTGAVVGIIGAIVNNLVGILTWLGSHFKP